MNFLDPYIGALKAGLVIGLLLSTFWFGHHVGAQGVQHDFDAYKLSQSQSQLKDAEVAITKQTEWNTQQKEAEDAAQKREATLQAAADSSRKSADGLRQQLADNQQRLSSATAEAVNQYAATVSAVFAECVDRYQAVARAADGHASDVQALMDAWPR